MGLWELDPTTKAVIWDDQCRALFGLAKDNLLSYEQATPYIHPDDVDRVHQALQCAMSPNSDGAYDQTYRTLGADDGRLRWVRFFGRRYCPPHGKGYRFAGAAQDVSGLGRARQLLEASENRFKDLITATPAATAVFTGRDMRIQQVNAPMLAIWGKEASVTGKPLHQAMPELEGQPFLVQLQHVFDTGQPFRHSEGVAQVIEDGKPKTVWFNHAYNPLYNEDGQLYGVINTAIDVTAQVRARQQIKESETRLELLSNTVPALIFYLDQQQRYQSYNHTFQQWFGVDEKEVIGKTVEEFLGLAAYEQAAPYLRRAYAGQPQRYELRAPSRLGGGRWLDIVYTPHTAPPGKVVGLIVLATDITASKLAESDLRHSEARYRDLAGALEQRVAERTQDLVLANQDLTRSNANLQQFAYVASHDLQEPLRKIQSFSSLLSDQFGDRLGEAGQDLLGRINKAGSRMSTLIKDLLTYSRISTRQQIFGLISLNGVIDSALESLSLVITERGAQIRVDDLPIINGDSSQLGQLFENLLSNGLKFTPTDQIPHLHIQYVQRPLSELPAEVRPNRCAPFYHQISVSDQGIGFDVKYLDRIFQVFQRLHGKNEFPGTGVGLAICQRVVENHGGAITARSKLGEGATFWVYLPA